MMRRLLPLFAVLFAGLAAIGLGPAATGVTAPTAPTRAVTATAATSATTPVAATGVAAHRVPPRQDYPTLPRYCATRKQEIPQKPVECHLNTFHAADPTIVLWGDSHAWMMIPALEAAVKRKHINLVAFVTGSCPPMSPGLPAHTGTVCDQTNELAIAYVRKLEDSGADFRALLGGSWQRYYHAIRSHDHHDYVGQQAFAMQKKTPRLFRALAKAHVPTSVDGQMPTVPIHKPACRRGELPYSCDLSRRTSQPQLRGTARFIKNMMKPLPGTPTLIGIAGAFCTHTVCHGLVDGIHTWFDDLHLSATRSATLAPYYAPLVNGLLADASSGSGSGSGGGSGGGCVLGVIC